MIYAKLDWYSVMLHNRSIDEVLRSLHIPMDVYEDIVGNHFTRDTGFNTSFVFSSYGVTCEIRYDEFLNIADSDPITSKVGKLRLDISGAGLDYLRTLFDVDRAFTNRDFWGSELDYHITRCDFAFDFVNYKPEFVNNLLFSLQDMERNGFIQQSSRLSVSRRSGIQYSYRCGDQKTIYFGSPRGDKLVRIYDKKLQYTKGTDIWYQPVPDFLESEGDVNSWFRIEFQTRRKSAEGYIFAQNNDLSNVLRVIFDDYLVLDQNKQPLQCLVDLYKWEDLPPIIQNRKSVSITPVVERSYNYVYGQALKSVFILIARYGVSGFINMLNDTLHEKYTSDAFGSFKSNLALRIRLSQMLQEEELTLNDLKGIRVINNDYYIKEDS